MYPTETSLYLFLLTPYRSKDDEALRYRAVVQEAILDMLQSDLALAARMAYLQDPFDAQSHVRSSTMEEIAARPPPGYSQPTPETTEELPSYTEAKSDGSITIQAQNWSCFSGLNLADLSAIKLIPIPLVKAEVSSVEFYEEEYAEMVGDALLGLSEKSAKAKAKGLVKILGLDANIDGSLYRMSVTDELSRHMSFTF